MKRVVLLRHGLTPWNVERRFQGQADVELDPIGHDQAAAVAKAMAAYEPTVLVTSDLARARQTADAVADATGLVPLPDSRLREIHVGELQGLLHAEAVERFGPAPWDYAAHGGETDAQVAARVAEAIRDVAAGLRRTRRPSSSPTVRRSASAYSSSSASRPRPCRRWERSRTAAGWSLPTSRAPGSPPVRGA